MQNIILTTQNKSEYYFNSDKGRFDNAENVILSEDYNCTDEDMERAEDLAKKENIIGSLTFENN